MLFSRRRGRLAALAVLALSPVCALARPATAGDIVVQRPWMRATPGGAQVAAGYLTLVNRGAVPDTLTGGTLDAATGFAVHDMAMSGGVMTMRPAGPVAIPPGGTLTLAPGGRHIMFTGLRHGLRDGARVAGTLIFAHAGTVPVTYAVEGIGARTPLAGDDAKPAMDMQ